MLSLFFCLLNKLNKHIEYFQKEDEDLLAVIGRLKKAICEFSTFVTKEDLSFLAGEECLNKVRVILAAINEELMKKKETEKKQEELDKKKRK